MKRNYDLVRAILLKVEAEGDPDEPLIHSLSIDDTDQALINEHVKLMIDDGLLEGECKFSTNNRILFTAIRGLTPRAYDFLENVRNDSVWVKIQSHVESTTGGASFDVIEKFANQIISAAVNRAR